MTNIVNNSAQTSKDHHGRNTVTSLQYYSGFMLLVIKGYNNLTIDEKIVVRASYACSDPSKRFISQRIQELISL